MHSLFPRPRPSIVPASRSPRLLVRRATALVALLASQAAATMLAGQTPGAADEERPLDLGVVITDSIGPTDVHTFMVEPGADHYLVGRVDQISADVIVRTLAPTGAVIGNVNTRRRGVESFQLRTTDDGPYRIEVRPAPGVSGRYAIELRRLEPIATDPEGQVDQLMGIFAADDVPGGVITVIRDGRPVFAKAYGSANLTYGIPFTTSTPTNIGSTSKQFTAFAIGLLDQRGILSLDDDVRKHIPELREFEETVTLRHLIGHTSGYREYLNTLAIAGRLLNDGDPVARDELIQIVQRQPALQNSPGAEWNYNNTGYGLLATVVERATGEPFADWMAAHVFRPLGMTNSYVRSDPSRVIPGGSQGYLIETSGGYRIGADLGAAVGAGGVYTTAEDIAKWIRNFGTGELGGADLIREMMTPYRLLNGESTGYGMGLMIDEDRGLRRVQHGGADIAHRSEFFYYPDIDAGVVVFSNNGSFGGMAATVAGIFLADDLAASQETAAAAITPAAPDPARIDPARLERLVGRYALVAAPGFVISVTRDDDRLFAQPVGQPRFPLLATSDTTFAIEGVEASLTFHVEGSGSAPALTLHQGGDQRARRLDWEPPAEALDAFVGRYFSEELETYYTVDREGDRLVLRNRRLAPVTLSPSKENSFTGGFPIAAVEFSLDGSGRPTSFSASNGRTRGVIFERME